MRARSGNLLLIELVIVALFLSLSSTVILRLYAVAHDSSRDSRALINATMISQNTLESMLNAPDMGNFLLESGYTFDNNAYVKIDGDILTRVELNIANTESGILESGQISIAQGDDTLITLPVSRYTPEVDVHE